MAIANLSYTGDFRMTIGEDKNKVLNIVYAKEINKMSQFLWYRSNTNKFEQDVSLRSSFSLVHVTKKYASPFGERMEPRQKMARC